MRKLRFGIVGLVCLAMTSCMTTGGNSSSGGDVLGGILGAINNGSTVADAITSVIGLDKVSAKSLIGTWRYNGPGCAFTSKNLLAKAGGEVVAAQIEQKMLPTYQKLGLSASNTYITFNQDGTFSGKVDGKAISGNYTYDEANSKITLQTLLLNINCYTKRELSGISLLFEASKLMTFIQTLSTLSGNTNLQTIGDLSKQYDGLRLGFDMKK